MNPNPERPSVADGPSAHLARFASSLRFRQLPGVVVQQARQSILDMIGVALAGSGLGEGQDEVLGYATSLGEGKSLVWATGERLSAGGAALANGVHGRALDYDDIIEFPQIHVAACVVPAVLAVLPLARERVTGQRLVTAVAIGCEIQSRLAAAIAPDFGSGLPVMLASQLFGYFSAAAACGHVLGLDDVSMQSALGLAQMHAAGTEEMVVHAAASVGKSLYAGLSNQGGVQCALMAMHGVVARGEPLVGRAGLFAACYPGGFDAAPLDDQLGASWYSMRRCIKASPGTLVGHAFVEAALALMKEHALSPSDVAGIELRVGPWGRVMCEPDDMRRRPPSASAAMNSIPWVVATAVAHGRIDIGDFTLARRSDAATLAMSARVRHVVDETLARPRGLEPGVVSLVLAGGQRIDKRVEHPLGHPERPLADADVAAKFTTNAGFAKVPRTAAQISTIIDCVERLAHAQDTDALMAALAAQRPL